jgi:hypothetical protein
MPLVNEYSISMFARRNIKTGRRAMIRIKGPEGDLATLVFRDEDVPTPAVKQVDDRNYELPMSAYLPMVDLLRHESPLHYQSIQGKEFQLFSGDEPVGEDES